MQNQPISQELLSILVCPESKEQVNLASSQILEKINQAISNGRVVKKSGQKAAEAISAGLIRSDNKILYPIVEGIPVMLVEEGLVLEGII
jgi:uncharacterized protein YbaR (Trm112 family)